MHGYRSAGHDYPAPNLTSCDSEAIHAPGMIQPHGVLFGLSADTLRISAISENVGRYGGPDAEDLLDVPLDEVIDPDTYGAIARSETRIKGDACQLSRAKLFGRADGTWRATLHRTGDDLLVEAETLGPAEDITALDYFERFQNATGRLQSASDVADICERLARETRTLTGYDRVMIYRFAPDWSGEVIAEDRNTTLPAYLGLHFPASDIPVQARALYAATLDRQIPDVGYTAVPLLLARQNYCLDLGKVHLRSVSPIHITYLKNMRVGASMSVSIIYQDRLWGLVACHHHAPRYIAPEVRQASVLLGQIAAVRLNLLEQAHVARRHIAVKAVETQLLHEAADGHDYRTALMQNSSVLLDLMDATGVALVSGGSVTTLGETPSGQALDALLAWLAAAGPDLVASDHLAALYPPATGWPEAAGILSVPLGGVPQNLLVWFRPEQARTVNWAGNPIKSSQTIAGEVVLSPRSSFEIWTQQMRGRAKPWSADEIAAANGLRDTIVEIIVRRSLLLENMNSQLARSNEELEAFAYLASHDLKEPLRQIETFGGLLRRAYDRRTDPPEKIDRWFAGIQNSSRRLRRLISDLAEFSRLGGHVCPHEPVALDDLVGATLMDFDARIEELGAQIEISPLPILMCDGAQIRLVLQNLIANALKYRHPDRLPRIRISTTDPLSPSHQRPIGLPLVCLRVEDNGIGFDERHRERIFEPFERLHSSDAYEGTGLGLAICRKVVLRHGGTITASGQIGVGAVFMITLPLRPLPEMKKPAP